MLIAPSDLGPYLAASEFIDRDDSAVREAHAAVSRGSTELEDAARRVYHFVRDDIRHSVDAGDDVVTLRASDVLAQRTGLCYSKSHLAAALMRLCGIPTGFCYQLLPGGDGLVLHGLIAVHLHGRWHRLDVRGLKPGLVGEFSLNAERLPFTRTTAPGLDELPDLLAEPAPSVVRALSGAPTLREFALPDGLD